MALNLDHTVTATPTVPLSIGEIAKGLKFAALRLQFAPLKPGCGMLTSNRELAGQVHSLKRKVLVHERNIAELVESMAQLLATPPAPPRRSIGFVMQEELSSKPKTTKGKK